MPILLTNEPTSGHGGIQRYVARLASALVDAGQSVTLLEPAAKEPHVDDRIRYRTFNGRSRVAQLGSAFTLYLRTASRARREPTIASIWFPAGLVVALVPAPLRGPLAIIAHGTEIAPSRGGLRKRLMRWTYGRARVVLANSELTRGLLAEAGVTERVVVALCGVDPRPLVRDSAAVPTLLMVGRLIPRKGFDRTIDAMPQILASIGNACLRIVGNGPQRAELEARVRALGLVDRVTFLGALDDAALADEYARAWFFIMPTRRIGDDVEGFGIVYLEAAIAGIGSIGGIGSGAQDAIADGETGLLVDGTDAAQIARAAIAVLGDRERAVNMGERARTRALESFGWERNAEIVARAIAQR